MIGWITLQQMVLTSTLVQCLAASRKNINYIQAALVT